MNLAILVPSEEYRSYAGARIRYGRIARSAAQHGMTVTLEDIGIFDPNVCASDAFLISKCYDGRSLIAAAAMSRRGKLVGVDLFDDYFSNFSDSRLVRYRNWLTQLLPMCNFALCSTSAIAETAAMYRGTLPIHVMNDPAPDQAWEAIGSAVSRKVAKTLNDGLIRVVWFGIGDNAYFDVGLSDLFSFSEALSQLARSGMAVELNIVTNSRALGPAGLALIAQLPVKVQVTEWSERSEQEALNEALIAFLPVNAGSFSTAKSLNRALTALSSGCQVLSAGFPLYVVLDRFIYRQAEALVADLETGALRLSDKTAEQYSSLLQTVGSAEVESSALAAFLSNLPGTTQPSLSQLALIHGHSTHGEAHRLVQSVGGLSVASPFSSAALTYDVVFKGGGSAMKMLVSDKAFARLLPSSRGSVVGTERLSSAKFSVLSEPASGLGGNSLHAQEDWTQKSLPFQLATYSRAMAEIGRRMVGAFGPCQLIVSESSRLPFPVPRLAA